MQKLLAVVAVQSSSTSNSCCIVFSLVLISPSLYVKVVKGKVRSFRTLSDYSFTLLQCDKRVVFRVRAAWLP